MEQNKNTRLKQTAVEYLHDVWKTRDLEPYHFLKAKEMEYEQICEAFDGFPKETKSVLGEDYYRTVYGD